MGAAASNEVDIFSIEDSGRVALTLLDSTDPSEDATGEHLFQLQAKLNAYLAFVDTGQMTEQFPQSIGRAVVIRVKLMHPPSVPMREFLRCAKALVEEQGFLFSIEVSGIAVEL
jgi:hypothetical protein